MARTASPARSPRKTEKMCRFELGSCPSGRLLAPIEWAGGVRVWVKEGHRKNSGHTALAGLGARRLPDRLPQISNLFDQGAPPSPPVQMELDF